MAALISRLYDIQLNVIVIGDVAGKTCILNRYTEDIFRNAIPTIGVDFWIKDLVVDGRKVRLQIWDTSGQKRFPLIKRSYMQRAMGVMCIFDITHQGSFNNLAEWMKIIEMYAPSGVPVLLVGNKCDLESYRKVSYDEGKQFAEANGMQYIETSAKTGHNVNKAFELLTKQMLTMHTEIELQRIQEVLNKQSFSVTDPSSDAVVSTIKAFQLAMRDGVAESNFFRLCLFGPENSGKTCLVATLFDEAFQHNEATEGADVHIATVFVSNWSKISTKQIADKLELKFYYGLNVTANEQIKSSSTQMPSQVPSTTTQHGLVSKLKAVFLKSHPTTAPEVSKAPTMKFEDIKQAKFSKVINKDEFTAVVWDFAGQIQYLSTHTVFIRKNNTVLIVFKASCDLSSFVKARENDQESSSCPKTTHFAVIHYWLQSISSVCHDAGGADHMSEFLPTAILVATHIDEILGNIEEAKEAIIAQLARELEGKPYAKHLAGNLSGVGLVDALEKYCIFLSNKTRDANTVTKLKELLLQVSTPTMKNTQPLVYLKIEKELLLLEKEVITTTEFHKIAVENGFIANEDSKEMKAALNYFHQKGVLLHFSSIESLVFLSPQWLEKLVAYLIIAHHYKPRGDEDDYSYKRLKCEGVLLGSFLQHMLQMFNKQQRAVGCEISFDQAVAFLVKFGFIAEIWITTEFLEESHPWSENEKRVFIVPSQLPEDNRERRICFVKEKIVWSIHFVFVNGFIPLTIFHHMISLCIKWNVSEKQSIAWLRKYQIMMVLDHGQYYGVSLCKEKSSIRLDIILEQNIKSYAESRIQVINFFQIMLNQTCDVFIPASAKPVAYTPCPYCSELHIKYKSVLEDCPHLCNMKSVPSNYYQDLFMDTQGISATKQVGAQAVGRDRTNLQDLLRYLRPVTKWQKLGVHLLPDEEIQIIYENHKNDVEACQFELFTKYMQMGDRSWKTVIAALIKSGYTNLAEDIKQQLGL